MALWGGRFSQGADSRFKQFNDSLRFDYRLAEQDIQGSMAWAKALVKVGVLTEGEQGKLQQAMMVRRFFAEETLDKITPIGRAS